MSHSGPDGHPRMRALAGRDRSDAAVGRTRWSRCSNGANVTASNNLDNRGTLTLVKATLAGNFSNEGTAVAQDIGAINGPVTTAAGSTLRVQATTGVAHLTVSRGFTNRGTIELSGTS